MIFVEEPQIFRFQRRTKGVVVLYDHAHTRNVATDGVITTFVNNFLYITRVERGLQFTGWIGVLASVTGSVRAVEELCNVTTARFDAIPFMSVPVAFI